MFASPLVAAAARAWSRRWPSAYLLLLRRRRRDTVAFTNLELLDKHRPQAALAGTGTCRRPR